MSKRVLSYVSALSLCKSGVPNFSIDTSSQLLKGHDVICFGESLPPQLSEYSLPADRDLPVTLYSSTSDQSVTIHPKLSKSPRKALSSICKAVARASHKRPVQVIVPEASSGLLSQLAKSRHTFTKHLSSPKKHPMVTLVSDSEEDFARQRAMATGTILARELANERADDCTPQFLHEAANHLAETHDLKITAVQGIRALESKGFNMISAVGQQSELSRGSSYAPRMIALEYNGGAEGEAPIVLVGKGVTFDTGGLNLKPTNSIETMHMDM